MRTTTTIFSVETDRSSSCPPHTSPPPPGEIGGCPQGWGLVHGEACVCLGEAETLSPRTLSPRTLQEDDLLVEEFLLGGEWGGLRFGRPRPASASLRFGLPLPASASLRFGLPRPASASLRFGLPRPASASPWVFARDFFSFEGRTPGEGLLGRTCVCMWGGGEGDGCVCVCVCVCRYRSCW